MIGLVASRLKEMKDTILSAWEERSLREVASAGTTATLALRDSVPIYLDHLSDALASNRRMDFRSVFHHDEESVRIGKLHGADRASNRSYQLTEVIFEYHILREVIFEALETDGPLEAATRDIILDSIEQAVNDAAVEFSEVHADIQQKFISTLTHDLKNPITAAKVNAEIIARAGSGIPALYVTSASRIVTSLNRVSSMIHDLLDASRVRAGEGLALQFIQCDLASIIRDVTNEMASVHGNRFVLNVEPLVEGSWASDGLRRVVENLLDNAVKYSTPGTPITVSLIRSDKVVLISVHNFGPHIPENELPLLFQHYRRAKSAQDGKQVGWGLGLTLVKGVINAHKGKIRVESKAGIGTTFVIELPLGEVIPAE
jgi:signal transduction histidine kinase